MGMIDRRRFLLTGLGAAGALALGSCTESSKKSPPRGSNAPDDVTKPAPRPTLRMAAAADLGLPSPFSAVAGPGYALMILMYDTLLQENPDGRMLPLLASDYRRSADGKTYAFTLRDDVKWHDDEPVTVDDVVFTFEYYALQTLPRGLMARPFDVVDVRATGAQTFEIRLDKAAVTFATEVAGQLPIVPKHIWSSIPDAASAQSVELLVGSGPYRLESYAPGEATYPFAANDGYFLGRPFVKRIEQRPVPDDLGALLAGDVDYGATDVFGVPSETVAEFRARSDFGVRETKSGVVIPMRWNLAKGGGLADVRVRQAVARAIDREDIVKRLTKGNGVPGNPGYLPPSHEYFVPVEQYPYDPAAANRMLDDAGYRRAGPGTVRQGPEGRALRYTLSVVAGIPGVLELVLGAVRDVGLELVPRQVALTSLVRASDYDIAIGFDGDVGAGSDPDHLRLVYSSGSRAFQHPPGYANPQVDDLCERQAADGDDADRKRVVADLQRLAAHDLPVLPLYYPTEYAIHRRAAFDQWSDGRAPTELKRNLMTGLPSGLAIRPSVG